MKRIKYYKLFKESLNEKVSYKNIIYEICTSMVLLNNEFLDNLLDKGLKARYSENSDVFITDLKNLLLSKNRLSLGKFENDRCVKDEELSKVNNMFDNINFDIEKDWDKLINARITARNIMDKLLPNSKLESDSIERIYYIGPNKTEDYKEDIVIETKDGKQYSFYLDKNLSTSKTASFSKFADDLIGENIDKLFKDEYLKRWDKLTQEWVRLIYENSNKNIQKLIEKFIDPRRIDDIDYFSYFDIRHKDPKFKFLGEHIVEFDKNILKLSDLLNEVWKDRENCFIDPDRITKEWLEIKIVILNSKILESLLTTSLKSKNLSDIEVVEDGFKKASGKVKMKLFKTLVEKMGCLERSVYFLSKNGNNFDLIPSKKFFREYYEDLSIYFDYHVKFIVSEDEENNDFKIKLKLKLDDNDLIDMFIIVKFTGSEMSGKLSANYKFILSDNFNYLISDKLFERED